MLQAAKFAFSTLRARPSRALLTLCAIILGASVILAISITNKSTLDSVVSLFNETSGNAQLIVSSATADAEGFPEAALNRIAEVPGIQAAVPSLQVQALLVDERPASGLSVDMAGALIGGVTVYGIDPAIDSQARLYSIVAGESLSPDLGAHEIVLVKDYAEQNGFKVGGDMTLLAPGGPETLRVVGLMSKEGAGQTNNGAFGIMPLLAAQEVFDRIGDLDQIDIVATPESATSAGIDALKDGLQARLGDEYLVTYSATRGKSVTQRLDTYRVGFGFFSAIALFVGAFLIYNAFSMTIVERAREIGMLRIIGMTWRQVTAQVLLEAAALGVTGAVLGVGFGYLLARGLIWVMGVALSLDVEQVQVPASGLVTSILVAFSVTMVSAAIPAWQAGRISPLEALRVRAKRAGTGWARRGGWLGLALIVVAIYLLYLSPLGLTYYAIGASAVLGLFGGATLLIPPTLGVWERIAGPLVSRLYGYEGQLGSSNIRRAKGRTALTVASLMVGGAMILALQSTTGAYQHDIENWIDKYVGGDLYVHSSMAMRADLQARLESVPGVAVATPLRYFNVRLRTPDGANEPLTYLAIDPASYRQVTSVVLASGEDDPDGVLDRLAEDGAVLISNILAEKYALEQGDTIRLETRRGPKDFEIAAIVVNFQSRGNIVEGSWADMRRYFGIDDVSAFLLKLDPGFSPEQVKARIDDVYGERRHLTVDSNLALKDQAYATSNQVFGMFNVLVLIAMVVAALGVVNTLTMSVIERTQEIGMLRSLGMTRSQVRKMILAEAATIGTMGAILGLMLGLLLSQLFLEGTSAVQGYELTYVPPTVGIVASLILAFVLAQVAAIWPAYRATRMPIIEAIQTE